MSALARWWFAAAVLLCLPGFALAAAFDPGRLGFRIVVDGLENPYRVLAIPVMPDSVVRLESPDRPAQALRLEVPDGAVTASDDDGWTWRAPSAAGAYPLTIRDDARGEVMTLNVLVMTPRSEKANQRIEGYRIGNYPRTPFRGLEVYEPPPGFIRVPREMVNLPVSPHFAVWQFLSKQRAGWPQFVLFDPELLLVLERLLEAVNDAGIRTDGFVVMSGYRTPFYNAAIGNGRHSRHQWGDAADIFIDTRAPHGRMDDLTGDGRSRIQDARLLAAMAKEVMAEMGFEGGVGVYGAAPHRGPFVHVDLRGFTARWEF